MKLWHQLGHRCQVIEQSLFPKPFRISPMSAAATAQMIEQLCNKLAKASTNVVPSKTSEKPAGLSVSRVKDMGNAVFDIQRNIDQLKKKHAKDGAVKRTSKGMKKLEDALIKEEIYVLDPTGEVWTEQREDCEPYAEPDTDPDITEPIISYVERPIIYYRSMLIQAAQILLTVPA